MAPKGKYTFQNKAGASKRILTERDAIAREFDIASRHVCNKSINDRVRNMARNIWCCSRDNKRPGNLPSFSGGEWKVGTCLLACINLRTVLRKYYTIPERIQVGHVGTCVPRAWEGAKVQIPPVLTVMRRGLSSSRVFSTDTHAHLFGIVFSRSKPWEMHSQKSAILLLYDPSSQFLKWLSTVPCFIRSFLNSSFLSLSFLQRTWPGTTWLLLQKDVVPAAGGTGRRPLLARRLQMWPQLWGPRSHPFPERLLPATHQRGTREAWASCSSQQILKALYNSRTSHGFVEHGPQPRRNLCSSCQKTWATGSAGLPSTQKTGASSTGSTRFRPLPCPALS